MKLKKLLILLKNKKHNLYCDYYNSFYPAFNWIKTAIIWIIFLCIYDVMKVFDLNSNLVNSLFSGITASLIIVWCTAIFDNEKFNNRKRIVLRDFYLVVGYFKNVIKEKGCYDKKFYITIDDKIKVLEDTYQNKFEYLTNDEYSNLHMIIYQYRELKEKNFFSNFWLTDTNKIILSIICSSINSLIVSIEKDPSVEDFIIKYCRPSYAANY